MTTKDIMIQWGFVIAFFWIPLFLFFPSTSHGAVLESNEGTSVDTENYGTSGGSKGQSFQHNVDFDIDSIEIWGGLGNSPASSVTLNVYDGLGNGGTVLCSASAVDVTGWPNWSVADWQVITLSGCTGLLSGTDYTFEVIADDGSGSDAIRWATSDATYADGTEYYNGSARTSRDAMFRINGTETGGGGGGGGGTTTVSSTTLVVNPSQDYFLNHPKFLYL